MFSKFSPKTKTMWILLILIFVLYVIGKISVPSFNTYKEKANTSATKEASFNGKDDEAVETVKRCKIPGTKGDVIQLASGYFDMAKSMGSFIEFEGWAGFQVSGPLYEVVVAWKANGEKKKARWDIDFVAKTIKPKNQEAFIFSGKNELLKFL